MEKRTPNYSIKEKHILLDLITKYKSIIENKGTSTQIINKKNETWQQIAEEFNAQVEVPLTPKHLRLLYANLKRKTRKDVAEEHKEKYIKAKIAAEEDKRQINQTGGGSYEPQLDDTGAQILAILGDQTEPLPNPFDDAADYFVCEPLEFEIIPVVEPGPSVEVVPAESIIPDPKPKPITTPKKKE